MRLELLDINQRYIGWSSVTEEVYGYPYKNEDINKLREVTGTFLEFPWMESVDNAVYEDNIRGRWNTTIRKIQNDEATFNKAAFIKSMEKVMELINKNK